MPRRPSSNPPAPGDQIRISFLLDRRREPELGYLFEMTGHGDRPRELLRLALLGLQYETEMKEMREVARRASLANLENFIPAMAAAEPAATRAPSERAQHAKPIEASVQEPQTNTEPVSRASAQPALEPIAQQREQPTASDVDGLDGFLA